MSWFRFATGMTAVLLIGYADNELDTAIPLSLLYLLPVCLLGTFLSRWQVFVLGGCVAYVAEYSDSFPWNVEQGVPRDALYLAAYTAAGLYVHGIVAARRSDRAHRESLQKEMVAREAVEEQLSLLVANSSLAIVIADESGKILEANGAASAMFLPDAAGAGDDLRGSAVRDFLPSLAKVQIGRQGWDHLKTMMQCQGLRRNKEPFLADVWFSSYLTTEGGRLTAMVMDTSVDVLDREEATLEQTLLASKLAVGALSHEIRNIASAITSVSAQLAQRVTPDVQANEVGTLQQLVTALERLSTHEVSQAKSRMQVVETQVFLRDLYIILSASLRDAGISLDWRVAGDLPNVWAESQSLLQVCLNLSRNAEAALVGRELPRLVVEATNGEMGVQIRFADNGPGPAVPDELFRPFTSGRRSPGLGLYLSRAMMRSMRGDLHYVPGPGASFVLELTIAGELRLA